MHERLYQKLQVWKDAHKFCLWVYATTKKFPEDEKFGLISQMRRSSSSVPTNIAEGNAKDSDREKYRFLETAHGSLEELSYQCLLSRDLQYITPAQFEEANAMVESVSIQLTKWKASLK